MPVPKGTNFIKPKGLKRKIAIGPKQNVINTSRLKKGRAKETKFSTHPKSY